MAKLVLLISSFESPLRSLVLAVHRDVCRPRRLTSWFKLATAMSVTPGPVNRKNQHLLAHLSYITSRWFKGDPARAKSGRRRANGEERRLGRSRPTRPPTRIDRVAQARDHRAPQVHTSPLAAFFYSIAQPQPVFGTTCDRSYYRFRWSCFAGRCVDTVQSIYLASVCALTNISAKDIRKSTSYWRTCSQVQPLCPGYPR
jgi:hypothetical protein